MLKSAFYLLITSVVIVSAFSQESLSLSDAIAIGLENNYDISIQKSSVQVARNNNSWGEAGRYPTITFNVNQNNNINENVKTASPFQAQGSIITNSVNPSINLDWILFNGFLINANKRRLDQLQSETEGNASIVIANTLQSIILGYYLAVLEKERLDEFRKQLMLSRDRFEYVKEKAEMGVAVTTDRLLEEGNYLTDSVDFINQQLLLRSAMRNLNILLAEEDVDKEYLLTDSLMVEAYIYNSEDLLSKMFQENVDLRRQYLTQSILGTNIQIERSRKYPSLALSTGFSNNRGRVDQSNASFLNQDGSYRPGATDPLTSVNNNVFINFRLSFTLFDGGRINRAIRNAIIQEDIGNIQIESMKNSLTADLLDALDRYETRKQLYGITARREEAAAINLEISKDRYQNGSINSFDFRIVQNNYLSASTLRLQSVYDLIDSHVELMRLTGGLIEEYKE
ncbi:MAG: TolC family protein [Bacteroidota bacterium]